MSGPALAQFQARYRFGFDDFQVRACEALEAGRGVLVAAPTGSGKTVVGEFAVQLALSAGRKCFYTTPIKALSNQKYTDLVAVHGAPQVGLLTGDVSVNGEAPVVVMTTEVLRNMLYAGSATLQGLGFVVMDEVHYLADRSRGAVWEEVIIHLPESVAVVSLSATVSNAEEFGEWLETVRGDTAVIVEEHRPVPLFQHVMVGRRLYDLFAGEGARVNEELLRVARDDWASSRLMRDRRSARKGRPGSSKNPRSVGNGRRVWIPSRVEVVDRLDRAGLLPAIVFIFSRAGCAAAVEQCVAANLRLTTPEERDRILAVVEERCRVLATADLDALGYDDFRDALSRGVASHHAGMLPLFKQCVEELFEAALVKVVFATETLALGVNMPARTVVIEKLTKYNGETHADITPGEYTQLTGRAGRRGLDVEGHAVVVWQPGLDPRALAGLASTRTYPLRSSFRPSYNMAVNLVHQFGRERARSLLELSFAQFQADRAVVGLARQLGKADGALAGYAEAAHCDRGDFLEYAALRHRISKVQKDTARARRAGAREAALASLEALRPGDIIRVPSGRYAGLAVVVDPGTSGEQPRPYVVTAGRQGRRLGPADFPTPVASLGRLRIPRGFSGRDPQARRDLASALAERAHSLPRDEPPVEQRDQPPAETAEVDQLRRQLAGHPCHDCPDREEHARWAERWFRLDRDATTLRRRVEQRTNSVARTFDRVCEVLEELGYVEGAVVTEEGRHLMRLYSESDLVAAEALRRGLWAGLGPGELAGVLSSLVYESRRLDETRPRRTTARVDAVLDDTARIWEELSGLEHRHRLDFLRQPDPGFAWAAWRWAEGDDLDVVLEGSGLAAGDFVRWVKQLVDLVDQVADAAGDRSLRTTARSAVGALRRGVVAHSALED